MMMTIMTIIFQGLFLAASVFQFYHVISIIA